MGAHGQIRKLCAQKRSVSRAKIQDYFVRWHKISNFKNLLNDALSQLKRRFHSLHRNSRGPDFMPQPLAVLRCEKRSMACNVRDEIAHTNQRHAHILTSEARFKFHRPCLSPAGLPLLASPSCKSSRFLQLVGVALCSSHVCS